MEYTSKILGFSEIEISSFISILEKRIGVKLFNNLSNPSRNNISNDGILFIPYAKKMIDDLNDGILNVYNNEHNDNSDDINILFTVSTLIGKSNIIDVLKSFMKDCDNLKIHIKSCEDENFSLGNSIESQILFKCFSLNDLPFFERRWKIVLKQSLYASSQYIKDVGIPGSMDDLRKHSVIDMLSSDNRMMEDYGILPSIVLNSRYTLFSAVANGFGIGIVMDEHEKIGFKKMMNISDNIKDIEIICPDIVLDFAIRRNLSSKFSNIILKIEELLLSKLKECGFHIEYY